MQSHPNYKGYDAIEGNPGVVFKEKTNLIEHFGKVTKDDLNLDVPKAWLPVLTEVSEWCACKGVSFCPSPFPYQIAKVIGDGYTIILWSSKIKKTRVKFIKPAFEGHGGHHDAREAMEKVSAIVGFKAS